MVRRVGLKHKVWMSWRSSVLFFGVLPESAIFKLDQDSMRRVSLV